MSLDVIARRSGSIVVSANSDAVLFELPIPSDCTMRFVNGQIHFLINAEEDALVAITYGFSGFIIRIPDPDAGVAVDTLWDQYIPKDADWAAGGFNLDTVSTDTAPEFEPGELDPFALFEGPGFAPEEIFRRRKYLSYATPGQTRVNTAANPAWLPHDFFPLNIRQPYRTATSAMALFGWSSPQLIDIQATSRTLPEENEWMFIKYARVVVELAWMELMGLATAGTGGMPHNEALTYLADLLEPNLYEASGAIALTARSHYVFGTATFGMRVPGEYQARALTSEATP